MATWLNKNFSKFTVQKRDKYIAAFMDALKSFFKELFEYSNYYNQQLAEVFLKHSGKLPDRSIMLFSHILNAHEIWNCRIEANENRFSVWQIHENKDLKQIDELNYNCTNLIIDKFDLNDTIQYSNTKGQIFTNTIRDILFHVINHSTYHRGQIAIGLKENNIEPLVTDYIFYKR